MLTGVFTDLLGWRIAVAGIGVLVAIPALSTSVDTPINTGAAQQASGWSNIAPRVFRLAAACENGRLRGAVRRRIIGIFQCKTRS